ncbi:MAG: putative DNA (cytosine-5)-methyltransferase [Prokaryotic dsDNA virus sp.]|nr:MAG: putative DNA (cytosine-5)-methyltransferase [Prokaryotic dsDNA virus sp.]|tara:strand:+ start:655 stop:1317 length:663 start_codon:yes stop_codon:yes gene_type:complete
MNILELFAGSRSFSKAAEELGYNTFSTDIKKFKNIDLVIDILELDLHNLKKELFKKGIDKIDCVWASPPCTYFSVASIGHHWNKNHTPKTKEAVLGCKIVIKTLEIIEFLQPDFFFIENPRGKLRKLKFMQKIPRATVTYCQYGDKRMKPTDIWTNHLSSNDLFGDNKLQGWFPRKICKNGDTCHESAPRGSQTGTQGIKGNYERSKVPKELCLEILKSL